MAAPLIQPQAFLPHFCLRVRLSRRLKPFCTSLLQSLESTLQVLIILLFAASSAPPYAIQNSPILTDAISGLQDSGGVRSLEPSTPVQGELRGGQSDFYRLQLNAGQYLRVLVDQKGIDVSAALFGPDRKKLAEIILPHTVLGTKVIIAVTEQSGGHGLEVRSQNKEAAPGQYAVRIAELRVATPRDRNFIAATRAFEMATPLREQGTNEALRQSLEKFEEAIQLFREAGEVSAEAEALMSLAVAHERLNENHQAVECYNKALAIYRTAKNSSGQASAFNRIAAAYLRLSDYHKALDFYSQALPLFRAENDFGGEASALAGMGAAYNRLNDYQNALDVLNKSLLLYRKLGNSGGEATVIQQMGYASYSRDEYAKAIDLYNQALALSRDSGDRSRAGSINHSIGQVYYHEGKFQKAIDFYQDALTLYRTIPNRRGEAAVLGAMGQVYESLGENQRALDYYGQALSVFRAIGERMNEATGLNNSAHVYVSMGQYQKALELYGQSLQICRLMGNRAGEASNANGLGLVYAGLRDHEKSLEFDRQALALFRAIGHRRGEADSLSHMGHSYLSLGENQKALAHLNDALTIYRALSVSGDEAQTLYAIALAHQALGDLVAGRSFSEAAIHLAEGFRHEVSSPQLRTSYFASVRDYYELNIDLLMQLHKQRPSEGHEVRALETSERARARTLLDLLVEARADIRQGADPTLLERERSVRQLLSARAERQSQFLNGKASAEQLATAERETEATLAEYQDIEAKIRVTSPRYAALTQPEPLSLKEIQGQVLDPETLLLEYSLGSKRSYLWAITQTSVTAYELPGVAEIEVAVRQFYDLAKVNAKSQELEQSADRLSRIVLLPVAEELGKKRLAIVTDGPLHYVPFAALPEPDQKPEVENQRPGVGSQNTQFATSGSQSNYRPLILEHEIVSLPSASTLAVLKREREGRVLASKLVAVVADPVFDPTDVRVRRAAGEAVEIANEKKETDPGLLRSAEETGFEGRWPLPRLLGTRREAQTIMSLVPAARSKRALDFEASRETATARDLSQYQVVHFATHALINNRHPELSGLVLSLVDKQGHYQNGFLRLNDIYNLRLPAELVVLSACQTGLGKEIRGEGLVGLSRGFMYAGAARLVTSLWQVDDKATSELMERFYRGMLTRRLSAAAALRAAQIEMWRHKDWRSPYYWAAFALQGEWQ